MRRPETGLAEAAAEIGEQALAALEELVAISSPSGDQAGAEAALAACSRRMPDEFVRERVPSSTPGCAPDLIARLSGGGRRRLLLLGHVDTVIGHGDHVPARLEGNRLYGPGTADMKGGVVLLLGVAGALAADPAAFAELSVLLVTDEEWRTAPFAHVERFSGYDACLCFEAGEKSETGEPGLVVRRKGAGTLRVRATGRAAHSGSAPASGVNALLALSEVAVALAAMSDPEGPERLTVTPTVLHSGDAFNVVPAAGELVFDLRSGDTGTFARVEAAVPVQIGGAKLEATMERVWPAMNTEAATAPLLAAASERLGRPLVARSRGGASDASHFAPSVPLTVDGLGPRGGGAHTPGEFVLVDSLRDRAEIALALALAALD